MEFFDSRYFRYVNMLLFCIVLTIAFSGQSFSGRAFCHKKLVTYLGNLSLLVYVIHYPILDVFRQFYPNSSELDRHFFLFMAVVLLCSVIIDFLLKIIIAGVGQMWSKLKLKMFVNG